MWSATFFVCLRINETVPFPPLFFTLSISAVHEVVPTFISFMSAFIETSFEQIQLVAVIAKLIGKLRIFGRRDFYAVFQEDWPWAILPKRQKSWRCSRCWLPLWWCCKRWQSVFVRRWASRFPGERNHERRTALRDCGERPQLLPREPYDGLRQSLSKRCRNGR